MVEINKIIQISKQAGEAILEVYHDSKALQVHTKADDSPLTKADLASHQTIVSALEEYTPDIPVLSEESKGITFAERESWQTFWLIDPLDGTKEFIAGNDDFTVNIALIENNRPIMGVIYIPVTGECYSACQSEGAYHHAKDGATVPIKTTPYSGETLRIVASRRHGLEKIKTLTDSLDSYSLINRGSSLKMCLVAEGKADVYPRFGPTSEWDTAAAQCIVESAGGRIVSLETWQPLTYNTRASLTNPNFLVLGDKSFDWRAIFDR